LTNTKSPGISVGDIDHVGITNEANKNTRNAIAKIMENITTSNQLKILLMIDVHLDFFPNTSQHWMDIDSSTD
jgi:hypothetical protein